MRSYPPLYPEDRPPGKKLFLVSDLHLGVPSAEESRVREKHFISWLREVAPTAAAIYLLGDVWDFWFEYRRCVPKGSVRLLGVLAELSDAGLPIYFMRGNHDQWLMGYLQEEVGLRLLPDPYLVTYKDLRFFLSHGHRLGPLPLLDKVANWMMGNPLLQTLYRYLFHPDVGLWLGRFLSGRSRKAHHPLDYTDLGEREYFYQYVQRAVQNGTACDWYIFAHRHLPTVRQIAHTRYVVLGEWMERYTYLEIAGESWALRQYQEPGKEAVLFSGLLSDAVVAV